MDAERQGGDENLRALERVPQLPLGMEEGCKSLKCEGQNPRSGPAAGAGVVGLSLFVGVARSAARVRTGGGGGCCGPEPLRGSRNTAGVGAGFCRAPGVFTATC